MRTMVALGVLYSASASACGGFFCSLATPVDQAGEDILFAVDGPHVTAQIRVSYEGPSEAFSWVMPLPSVPTVGVGSDAVFAVLRTATEPRFELQWNLVPGCTPSSCWDGSTDATDASDASEGSGGGGFSPPDPQDPVVVLAQGNTGPYDYQVVQSSDGQALYEWLDEHGYDQPPSAKGLIQSYANLNFVFLALRLEKDADSGAIQPVVLEYDSPDLACVPLRLTAIAATPDMPIRVWVASAARAIPLNAFHVVPDERDYPWLSCLQPWMAPCATAWQDLVTRSVDEANGQAFVTEYAGPAAPIRDQVVAPDLNLAVLATITSPDEYLARLRGVLPPSPAVQDAIRRWIPMPKNPPGDCANEQAFYSPGSGCMALSPKAFDPKGFSQDLHDRFVAPLRDLRIMLTEHPYLTRLFTTLSPEEMAWDPMFAFNPDLPDVSNVHRARLTPTCTIPGQPDGLTLDFADGTQWATDAAWDACGTPTAEEPAYGETRIEILGEQGAPEAVAPSQVTTLQASLELRRPALRSPVPTTPRTPTAPAVTDDDEPIRVTATCGVTGGAQAGLSALLVAALLALGRRRS